VKIAGIRIRPHTADEIGSAVLFPTLANKTGLLDVTVFPDVYDRFGGQLFETETTIVSGNIHDRRGLAVNASRGTAFD